MILLCISADKLPRLPQSWEEALDLEQTDNANQPKCALSPEEKVAVVGFKITVVLIV